MKQVPENPNDQELETQTSSNKLNLYDKHVWVKGFEITKENIGFVLIIISGLGAALQIIEIAKIDLAYIRFFSVSQLVADGTLIAITLVISYIAYRIYLISLTVLRPITDLEEAVKNKDKEFVAPLIPEVLIFYISVMGVAIVLNKNPFEDNIVIMIAISAMMIASLVFVLKFFILVRKNFQIRHPKKANSIGIWMLIIGPAGLIIYSLINIGYIYSELYKLPTPDKLANYQYIDDRIKETYGKEKKYSVRYFNDKYTFVEIGSNENIIIYKTDDILFNAQHIIIENN